MVNCTVEFFEDSSVISSVGRKELFAAMDNIAPVIPSRD